MSIISEKDHLRFYLRIYVKGVRLSSPFYIEIIPNSYIKLVSASFILLSASIKLSSEAA